MEIIKNDIREIKVGIQGIRKDMQAQSELDFVL